MWSEGSENSYVHITNINSTEDRKMKRAIAFSKFDTVNCDLVKGELYQVVKIYGCISI